MASPSPPSRVLSHAQPAHPSRVWLRTKEGARKTLEADVHERGAAPPQEGAPWVGATEKFGSIPKKERERETKEQE